MSSRCRLTKPGQQPSRGGSGVGYSIISRHSPRRGRRRATTRLPTSCAGRQIGRWEQNARQASRRHIPPSTRFFRSIDSCVRPMEWWGSRNKFQTQWHRFRLSAAISGRSGHWKESNPQEWQWAQEKKIASSTAARAATQQAWNGSAVPSIRGPLPTWSRWKAQK